MTSPVIHADSSASQKHRHRGDVSDATQPAERHVFREDLSGTIGEGPGSYIAFRFCVTRSAGVDANLPRRKLDRQSLRQRFDCTFRESIQQGSRDGMRSDNGTQIDDGATLSPEPLARLLHSKNRPADVDVEVEMKVVLGNILERLKRKTPALLTRTSSLPSLEPTSSNKRRHLLLLTRHRQPRLPHPRC